MHVDTAKVSVEIGGGPAISIPWTEGMTAQNALEAAWTSINSTATFTYALQYYGKALGYMVFMINETFDSFLSTAAPYFYWEFLVDGASQNQGIDGTILDSGSVVAFRFTQYLPGEHAGTMLEAKHSFQKERL